MSATLLRYRILPTARISIDEFRNYVVRTSGWETWRQTSAQMQDSITQVRRFPESGHIPVELEGFVEGGVPQILFGKNRIIYQVRDDTVFIHLVVDVRRDLPTLLQR